MTNRRTYGVFASFLLACASGCCTTPGAPMVLAGPPVLPSLKGREYRVVDGFPQENQDRQIDLVEVYFRPQQPGSTVPTYVMVGCDGYKDAAGMHETNPAVFRIHRSEPTPQVRRGFMYIKGDQSVVETDKTTIHSWGTRYIVWVRPVNGAQARQDVVFALDHPVCVTPTSLLPAQPDKNCVNGTLLQPNQYLIITYPASGQPVVGNPQPFPPADRAIGQFLEYANQRAADMKF